MTETYNPWTQRWTTVESSIPPNHPSAPPGPPQDASESTPPPSTPRGLGTAAERLRRKMRREL